MLIKNIREFSLFILAIEALLVVLTYMVSNNWLTAGVALLITVVGYVVCSDNNPFGKALRTFYIACTAGFIYFFGIYAGTIAKTIPGGYFIEMKEAVVNLSSIFIAGATPPFNITGNGPVDLTIFVFGFAILETFLKLIRLYLSCR